jgi:hypothetical protein
MPASSKPIRSPKAILADRRRGLYRNEETADENAVCARQMTPTDVCYTLIHRMGVFNVYNNAELLQQMKAWKGVCVIQDYNLWEREVGGKTVYVAIIQPKDKAALEDCPICPLAMSMGILVSGFTYIFQKKEDRDFVAHYLRVLAK